MEKPKKSGAFERVLKNGKGVSCRKVLYKPALMLWSARLGFWYSAAHENPDYRD